MERLNQRTLLSLLESLLGLYAIQNLDAFAANILAELPKFVPSDVIVYSQVNPPQINLIEQPVATDRFPGITERDRLCLNVLRPHLIQADRNAEMVTEMEREMALITQGIELLRGGVIVLARAGGVRAMSRQARQWLGEYFGTPTRHMDDLPAELREWIGLQEALLRGTDDVPPPLTPLVVKRPGKHLVVRLLSEHGRCLLLLEERLTALDPSSLEPLGLTRREAQVLAWVAEGRSNEQVGRILGVAPLTVKKHLEHVYQKLGVESRTAAAARAREAVG